MTLKRRTFLKQLAGMAAASAFPAHGWIRKALAASPTDTGRRHLINVIGRGGWDSSPFHNTFSAKHLLGREDACVSDSAGGFPYDQVDKTYKYTTKCTTTEGEEELGTHPNGFTRLGPAVSSFASASDLQDVLIWKGMTHPELHGFNNVMINHGNNSTYATSFSGLIAQLLAQTDRRPLHYVLMSESPASLYVNSAMVQDAAIPICLADAAAFTSLTARSTDEPSDSGVIAEMEATVQSLALEVLLARAKLASSRTVASAFQSSFEGAQYVYGSNLAADPELKYLWKYYFLEGLKPFVALSSASWLMNRASRLKTTASSLYYYSQVISDLAIAATAYSALPDYAAYMASPATYATSIADIAAAPTTLRSSGISTTSINRLRTQSWYYAFADFLVRRNLSACVDIPAWPSKLDAHGGATGSYLDEFISIEFTYALWFALLRSLKSVPLPDLGCTLFERTMLTLHTEFDRFPYHEGKTYEQRLQEVTVGTNHAPTASVILAGYRIRPGVIGGVHEGPNMADRFPNQSYLEALPINPNTGAIDPDGVRMNILAVAPTILSAFGTTMPLQQITDSEAVPAAIRS